MFAASRGSDLVVNAHLKMVSFSLLLVLALSGLASACIGEIAGPVNFNISAGSSQTLQMGIFNSCLNQTVEYSAIYQLTAIANKTSPTVALYPTNGTLQPRQTQYINITVSVPYNATAGTIWKGAVAAAQVANQSAPSGGGAVLNVGVVKLFTITAQPPKFNPLIYALVGGIAAGLIAAGGVYYYKVRKRAKKPVRKRAAPRKRRAARKRPARKAGKAQKKASPRKTARRRRRRR